MLRCGCRSQHSAHFILHAKVSSGATHYGQKSQNNGTKSDLRSGMISRSILFNLKPINNVSQVTSIPKFRHGNTVGAREIPSWVILAICDDQSQLKEKVFGYDAT